MKTRFFYLVSLLISSACIDLSVAQDPPPAPGTTLPPAQTEPPVVQQPPAVVAVPEAPANQTPPPAVEGLVHLGSAVPESFREDRYEATFKKNPFATRTTAPTAPPGPGLADDWELNGIQDYGGVQRALIKNKKTAETKHVSAKPDKDGFVLVKLNFGATRKQRTVEIAKGPETATLSFPETVSAPTAPGGRPPGMPGQAQPGMSAPRPYGGSVTAGNPNNGIRPPVGVMPRPTTGGAMPPNVTPVAPGQQPGSAPTSGSRRRLLVPTPTPGPGSQQPQPGVVP